MSDARYLVSAALPGRSPARWGTSGYVGDRGVIVERRDALVMDEPVARRWADAMRGVGYAADLEPFDAADLYGLPSAGAP